MIKLASTTMARPGEFVDFTIRFDNIGDQKIGNVTLVDNLTTRLEYVEGSAEASLAADFSATPNEGDSLLLRWEFADPFPAGDGGVVRFRCRVRVRLAVGRWPHVKPRVFAGFPLPLSVCRLWASLACLPSLFPCSSVGRAAGC